MATNGKLPGLNYYRMMNAVRNAHPALMCTAQTAQDMSDWYMLEMVLSSVDEAERKAAETVDTFMNPPAWLLLELAGWDDDRPDPPSRHPSRKLLARMSRKW